MSGPAVCERRDTGQALRHRLQQNQTESFKQRRENKEIVFPHFSQNISMGKRGDIAAFAKVSLQNRRRLGNKLPDDG